MKTAFDEIFVIHLADNMYRMLNIDEQFLKLEIKPTIYYTTKRPFSNKIANVFRPVIETNYYNGIEASGNSNVYGNVFNCTLAHYDIIKTSYERGLERILICEDDICFCDDLNLIHKYFNTFPEDYDIIKYHSSFFKYNNKEIGFTKYSRNKFTDCYGNIGDIFSTMCYSLNRSGMKYYIEFINNCFSAADIPFCILDQKIRSIIIKNKLKIPNIYNINHKICWPLQKYESQII